MTAVTRRVAASFLAGVLGLALAGCAPGKRIVRAAPKPQPERAAVGTGISIRWQEKLETGALRMVLDLQAERGQMDTKSDSGSLKQTRGTFFRDGKAVASFSAPEVKATRDDERVIASGGVTVHSIEPSGMTVTAERVVWDSRKDKIIAQGNVTFARTLPGETKPSAWSEPQRQITLNTEMKRLTIP